MVKLLHTLNAEVGCIVAERKTGTNPDATLGKRWGYLGKRYAAIGSFRDNQSTLSSQTYPSKLVRNSPSRSDGTSRSIPFLPTTTAYRRHPGATRHCLLSKRLEDVFDPVFYGGRTVATKGNSHRTQGRAGGSQQPPTHPC